MATNDGSLYGSVLDIAQMREGDSGNIAQVINLMARMSPLYGDMLWRPTNAKVLHETTRLTALPAVYRRRLNQGVAASKAARSKVVDRCTHIEARSKVDAEHKEIEGDAFDAFRSSEDAAFLETFMQRFEFDMFYATTATDAEDMSGLAQRYANPAGQFGGQLIHGGGTSGSDQMSMWLVTHGEANVHAIYPKNTTAGFKHDDLGKDTTQDDNGREYLAYVSLMTNRYGLSVRDPRSVARVCNIDSSAIERTVSSGPDLLELAEMALEKTYVAGVGTGKKCFYVPRTIFFHLMSQARNKSNVDLTLVEAQTYGDPEKKWNPSYLGVPFKLSDALTETESPISFS